MQDGCMVRIATLKIREVFDWCLKNELVKVRSPQTPILFKCIWILIFSTSIWTRIFVNLMKCIQIQILIQIYQDTFGYSCILAHLYMQTILQIVFAHHCGDVRYTNGSIILFIYKQIICYCVPRNCTFSSK